MDMAEVQGKLTHLNSSVDALIALQSTPVPVDLQPIGDAIDAIQTKIDTKLSNPTA